MMGRSMLAYIPVNVASIIVSFGGLAILTRLLDSAEYGRYALALITMMAVHMALFTWLEAAMARYQARAEREDNVNSHVKSLYISAAGVVSLGWSFAMAVLMLLPLSTHMTTLLGFAISSTCLQLFFNLGMEAHKAAHRIARYSASYSFHQMFAFVFGIILIMTTPLRELGPFIGLIVATLLVCVIDLPFMFKKMKGGSFEKKRMKSYFQYGMPISVSLILTYALSSGDMYIITGLLGESAAGEYSASYNFANRSLDILFIWIGMAVTPIAVTALEKEGLEKSRDIMRDYGAALLWIAMPAATGIALVAEPAGFILGESVRAGAVKIMPLIAFAGVLNGMISYYAQRAFMLSGKTQMFVWAMVPPVLLNIALNFLWIPTYGLMGAVYATLASYALGFVVAVAIGRRHYPLPLPVKAFAQISFACLVMAGVVLAIPIPTGTPDFAEILIKATVGILTYGVLCFGTNTANCRSIIKSIFNRVVPNRMNSVVAAE